MQKNLTHPAKSHMSVGDVCGILFLFLHFPNLFSLYKYKMENGEWTVGKITNGFFKLFYRCVMDVLRFRFPTYQWPGSCCTNPLFCYGILLLLMFFFFFFRRFVSFDEVSLCNCIFSSIFPWNCPGKFFNHPCTNFRRLMPDLQLSWKRIQLLISARSIIL